MTASALPLRRAPKVNTVGKHHTNGSDSDTGTARIAQCAIAHEAQMRGTKLRRHAAAYDA